MVGHAALISLTAAQTQQLTSWARAPRRHSAWRGVPASFWAAPLGWVRGGWRSKSE
jgi:hypothetical protein